MQEKNLVCMDRLIRLQGMLWALLRDCEDQTGDTTLSFIQAIQDYVEIIISEVRSA